MTWVVTGRSRLARCPLFDVTLRHLAGDNDSRASISPIEPAKVQSISVLAVVLVKNDLKWNALVNFCQSPWVTGRTATVLLKLPTYPLKYFEGSLKVSKNFRQKFFVEKSVEISATFVLAKQYRE